MHPTTRYTGHKRQHEDFQVGQTSLNPLRQLAETCKEASSVSRVHSLSTSFFLPSLTSYPKPLVFPYQKAARGESLQMPPPEAAGSNQENPRLAPTRISGDSVEKGLPLASKVVQAASAVQGPTRAETPLRVDVKLSIKLNLNLPPEKHLSLAKEIQEIIANYLNIEGKTTQTLKKKILNYTLYFCRVIGLKWGPLKPLFNLTQSVLSHKSRKIHEQSLRDPVLKNELEALKKHLIEKGIREAEYCLMDASRHTL